MALGTLGVLGKGSIYGAHWVQPLENTAASSQSFNAGADYKRRAHPGLPEHGRQRELRARSRLRSTMSTGRRSIPATWWRGSQTYSLTAGINFGVRGLVNSPDEFANARYNANPDYFYVRLGFNGTRGIALSGFALLERMSGQWADSPLVNNEQFSLGGVDTVRGYLEAETLGDSGSPAASSCTAPPLGPHVGPCCSPLYGFVFVDGGHRDAGRSVARAAVRTSRCGATGVGLRLENPHGFTGSCRLRRTPSATACVRSKGDSRIDFSAALRILTWA